MMPRHATSILITEYPKHFERAGDILRESGGFNVPNNGGSHRGGVRRHNFQLFLRRVITLKGKGAAGKALLLIFQMPLLW